MSEDKRLFEVEVQPPTPEEIERQRVREEYRDKLAEKLKDPEFRKIEGFPIGTDEAILALSDPPYYTACPNPFIEEWLKEHSKPFDPDTDDYHREPFAADVSEGKNHPIYNAHSYHTKVPHRAIMRYILHYTEPGDIVFDGFCGTGMTGVAAQLCGDRNEVAAVGYSVDADGNVLDEHSGATSRIGTRVAVLSDLSPYATFIAASYNDFIPTFYDSEAARHLVFGLRSEFNQLYTTDSGSQIEFTIWSELYTCPHCGHVDSLFSFAVDPATKSLRDRFDCSRCATELTKEQLERIWQTLLDYDGKTQLKVAQVNPVEIVVAGTRNARRSPTEAEVGRAMSPVEAPYIAQATLPHGRQTRKILSGSGISRVHQLFFPRSLSVLDSGFQSAFGSSADARRRLLFLLSASLVLCSRRERYRDGTGKGSQTGNLYVPSLQVEKNAVDVIQRKQKALRTLPLVTHENSARVSTSSHAHLNLIPAESIDYIFTDPPFGESLQYAELNFVNEAWLRVTSSLVDDCVVNYVHKKDLAFYSTILKRSFSEAFRILKPGRWVTVEFHNSENAVWSAIQEALVTSGFTVADVRILDKQQGGYNAVTRAGAVKRDLVISCYKAPASFSRSFEHVAGTIDGAVQFTRLHLSMLPTVVIGADEKIEILPERSKHTLFDRMVAFHLVRGLKVPLSAASFYSLLEEQFYERDGMYFTAEQVVEYDVALGLGREISQQSLFVYDERSAVDWLRRELSKESRSLGELVPEFLTALRDWDSHEERPELKELLLQYFIREDDENWVVPDPENERHLEELRQKAMLREFQDYVRRPGQLKLFRTEAVLAGFAHCWETKQYDVIVGVCERIPPKVLQEVQDLVMFYDIAKERAPEKITQFEFKWE